MAYADAAQIDITEIPVIDLSPLRSGAPDGLQAVATDLRAAAEGIGFFYIRNHGIDADLIEQALDLGRRFFALPPDEKAAVAVNSHHRGHIAIGQARMEGQRKIDLKESFVWGQDRPGPGEAFQDGDPLLGPNQWPTALPEMAPVLSAYMEACNALGRHLLMAFATSLDIPADTFVRRFDRPVSRASLLYYPPQAPEMGTDQFGVSPHTDFGCLTLLHQDPTGGLQVQARDGTWIAAPPIPGTYVVNVGDLLARWTNDRFASTPHRVVNTSGRERLSMPVFVDPDHDALIAPVTRPGEVPHYPPVTVAEHILGRVNRSFAYRQNKETFR